MNKREKVQNVCENDSLQKIINNLNMENIHSKQIYTHAYTSKKDWTEIYQKDNIDIYKSG